LSLPAHAEDTAFPLDLSKVANMGFRDDVADDRVGGWTDQGGNDFRRMPLGEQTLCGVPFRILDPAKNGGKSCLALRGHGRVYFPESAKVAVNRKAGAFVFLHALAWADEQPVAHYVIGYADGKSEDVPIRQGKEILGWWGENETEEVKIAVRSANLATRMVCLHAWAWKNPRPETAIESIEFRSTGSQAVPVIVAVTALGSFPALSSERPGRKVPPDGFVMVEAERFATYNVPPTQEPKDEEARKRGEKVYDTWADARFSGGHLFEIKPAHTGPLIEGSEKPQYVLDKALKLTYEFEADKADTYVCWTRVGPANVYSPFRWRVDAGEWGEITRQDPFLDMWEISFWVTLGWIRLGERRLEPGKHVLHIEVPDPALARDRQQAEERKTEEAIAGAAEEGDLGFQQGSGKDKKDEKDRKGGKGDKEEDARWVVMADCFAISRVPFQPCGNLKAGEQINSVPWLDGQARAASLDLSSEKIAGDGTRERFWLDGVWEMARDPEPIPSPHFGDEKRLRGPLTEFPDPGKLAWMGVLIPHTEDRPETALLNRRWYRKFVGLPKDLEGKRLSIHFSEANYTASVFVNGRLCGTHFGGYVPFAIDIADAIQPGEANEILVGVKGLAYYRKEVCFEIPSGFRHAYWRAMLVPGLTGWNKDNRDGLPGSVRLETHAQVAGHDVFVQSKFADRKLTASVEVDNRSGKAFAGKARFTVHEPETGGQVAVVGEKAVALGAGQTAVVEAVGSAEGLMPWWPGQPKLYTIRAAILDEAGKPVDVLEDRFGYREVRLKGTDFLINDKRCNFRSVITGGQETLEETMAQFRESNSNTLRLPHTGYACFFKQDAQRSTLRFMDEQGVAVRFNSQINGMFIDLATDDDRFWNNATDYFRQVVKAYRNHPSILVWTAENELDLISNMANQEPFKRRQWTMMKVAHEIDPTRPIMGDGAGDLLGECEVCNWHYCEVGPIVDPNDKQAMSLYAEKGVGAVYPDNAFTLARLPQQCQIRPWDRKRPLWVGETYFYSGPVKWQCWVGGDEALSGRFSADEASARFIDMLCRGYRWQDVAGFDIFTHADRIPGQGIRNSMSPVAVFSRDYHRNHYGGGSLTRRLKIFNDTLDPSPIRFEWELAVEGKAADSGASEHVVEPGQSESLTLAAKTPEVQGRADGVLRFRLTRARQPMFQEQHPISVFAKIGPVELPNGVQGLVYDPSGRVLPMLTGWGFREAKNLDVRGPRSLLVVGPDALKKDPARDFRKLTEFVRQGGRALVLEQNFEFPEKALPFAVKTLAAEGSMAYPRGAHPALQGVKRDDLSVWGQDQVVFQWPFERSEEWPLIVDASTKDGMNLAPVIETAWGKGHCVLSQLLIGRKLGSEPMAERLLANSVRYLANLPEKKARLASFLDPKSTAASALKMQGFGHKQYSLRGGGSMEMEMALTGEAEVVLVPGTSAAVRELSEMEEELRKFTQAGGWILLLGLEEKAVQPLSKLVGVDLHYRPVGQERIGVVGRDDPLMAGLGNHEFYWEQHLDDKVAEEAHFLFGDRPLRADVLTGAILFDDICALSRNVAVSNHLTSEDHWKYILYCGDTVGLNWGQPFEIHRVVVRENRHYKRMEEISLVMDGDEAHPMTREVPKVKQPIVFEFPARKASSLTLKATKFVNTKPHGPFGWDTVEVFRTLSEPFRQKVVPLTDPAGIVKFPMGKGGILLNTTSLEDKRGDRVLMQLLHNLGVARTQAGGKEAMMETSLPGAGDGGDEPDPDL
jgi:beta-galactosidase